MSNENEKTMLALTKAELELINELRQRGEAKQFSKELNQVSKMAMFHLPMEMINDELRESIYTVTLIADYFTAIANQQPATKTKLVLT